MRWLGFADDPTAGGTTLEDLESDPIAVPDTFVPVTSANVDPRPRDLDRDNENRGRRANVAPISFASDPQVTFESRAYPKLVRTLLRKALGGTIGTTGAGAAARVSTVGPLQEGNLPPLLLWLVREGQLDRVTGAVVDELEFNFAIDEEGTVQATLPGLYHDVDPTTDAVDPSGDDAEALPTAAYPGYTDTFMLRDATAFRGPSAGVELTNLAGFGFTFNNNLIDDFRSRFQPNHNIEEVVIDGTPHKIWYPARHKLGPQVVTGRIDFSDVDPDAELRRIVRHAEKLVFEVAAGPLTTTPPVDEMMRLTFYKQSPSGGGAEPLQREGDQVSSYEFTAYLDETSGKDVAATLTGVAALV
jgi:hypothetical protein